MVIQPALFRKIADSQEVAQLLADFSLVSGLDVQLVDPSGQNPDHRVRCPAAPMCRAVQSGAAGRRLCEVTVRQVFAEAERKPVWRVCDAGLVEAAVAVEVRGLTVGMLRLTGARCREADRAEVARIEHLLRRAEAHLDRPAIGRLLGPTLRIAPDRIEAGLRVLAAGIQRIASRLGAQAEAGAHVLPGLVVRAVREIHRRAFVEDLDLEDLAEACGVSPSHLSRVFHQATGLTFREYLARLRAERAYDLLLLRGKSITDIAFEAGFQSLSQFNRTLRKVYGQSPRQIRARRTVPGGA